MLGMLMWQSDVMMIEFLSSLRRNMAELRSLDAADCPECSGPPPMFRLPPPPRPPFLKEGTFCSEAPLAELEDCGNIPLIDVSYHNIPSLQSTALIVTCAIVLLLTTTTVFVVFWNYMTFKLSLDRYKPHDLQHEPFLLSDIKEPSRPRFLARPCFNIFGLSRVWQCLPTCCQTLEGPAASLIHAPLKETNDSRRAFVNQQPHPHQYRHYAVQHTDTAAMRTVNLQSDLTANHERFHYNCRSVSNNPHINNPRENNPQIKSPGRPSANSEHVMMLLSVAAQLTNKKPRFL
ncbi:uncharacterized protein LOC123265401 isoform X1 [Cotesia glomerata]|uniref:uncharacterized protein LOC123265401 isoform X1 n=2 Tax=Cotesia glomerata TaxID=32391 RepID=UPI001D01FDA7|nr:uncharacterized protein LOC123265401 isoform X1 [Cotesia glomerata]